MVDQMRMRRREMIVSLGMWFVLLWMVVPVVLSYTWPASYYMTVSKIVVKDAALGQAPQVLSDREFIRDHARDIHVTIEGLGEAAGYMCDRYVRELDAKAGRPFPPDMTLDRFIGAERENAAPCQPRGIGDYTMAVTFIIHGPLGSRIKLPIVAEAFSVHEPEWVNPDEPPQ